MYDYYCGDLMGLEGEAQWGISAVDDL